MPIGSVANLGLVRKGQRADVQFTLGGAPEDPPRDATRVEGRNPFAGAMIENISPAVIEETGVQNIERGVIVTDVKEDTPASSVGLRPKDIVLSVNNVKTTNVADVLTAIKRRSEGWRISVMRGDDTISIMVGG